VCRKATGRVSAAEAARAAWTVKIRLAKAAAIRAVAGWLILLLPFSLTLTKCREAGSPSFGKCS
jgi:hypothetical protein